MIYKFCTSICIIIWFVNNCYYYIYIFFDFSNLVRDSKNPSHHCTSPSDLLKLFLSFCDHVRMTEVYSFDSSLETIAPFPNIFSQSINQHGFVESSSRSSTSGNY